MSIFGTISSPIKPSTVIFFIKTAVRYGRDFFSTTYRKFSKKRLSDGGIRLTS